MTRKMKTYLDNTVSALCVTLLTVQPVLAQSIVATDNGPVVMETANGTVMVMINTPDANGVSHNTYMEFGVGTDGAILNNVDTNTAQTQIGGIVQGNGNLADGAASIIINEVTTNNPSLLNGYLEVGGQRADVIVANPYGITCDGCGFINTDRLTMTTGTPTYEGGSFTGLSVDGGAVNIAGGGLDASDTTRFDLISRQISVAGAVQGQRIRVIAGRNDVIYATGEITEKADDGSEKPELAIDSTVVGGMFANAITITSTEDGVGVRAPQDMAANAGGMMITADGRLVMRDASASQNVTVQSTADVVIEGTVVAQQDVEITTPEDLILEANAVLVADSAAMLNAGGLTLGANAELATGTQISATIDGAVTTAAGSDLISDGTATITADTIANNGTLAATGGALMLTTTGNLVNTGLVFGDTSAVLRSDAEIFNNGGDIVANGNITIRGDNAAVATAFTNQYSGLVETITGNITIAATDINNLREAPLIDGDPALSVDTSPDPDAEPECSSADTCFDETTVAGQITVVGEAAQIISAGNITLTGTDIVNAYSLISAGGNININAATLENIGLNVYRNTGGSAEFVGAVFGTIEARGDINGTGVTGYVNNGAFGDNAVITNGSANPDLSDAATDVINNSDLLVESVDPDSEFLVETRPEFVDLDQFISSDYFLEAIEYDPELRRFGDAYAEALYIRKQLQELLGQLILTVGGSERAQIQAMYDNAIDAQANLDLTPGVALTPDQIGALTSDIVWLEPTVVNGETVLAPKVYLANPEIRLAALGGAMITGRDVTFTTGNFDNAGVIRAANNVSIIAEDTFRSISGSVSAENIVINADTIEIATDARRVVTEQGTALIRLPIFKSRAYTDNEDVALRTSTFAAGSTIVLTARDSITTTGAQISAGDNITLLAGGDITIGALALASAKGDRRGSNRNYVERVDHLTTSLTAGGDIMLLSSGNAAGQNDIVLEGANLTAGGDVGMIAQDGDLLLAAVQDFYFRDYRRKKSGAFGFNTKVRERMTTRITNQVVEIEGASITGVADNNIYVEGSRFVIPGVAGTDMGPGQLSMVSVNGSSVFAAPFDIFVETSYRNNATVWGLVSNSTTSKNAHNVARGVFADTAGDIALNSGGDLTLTAVDFNAGGEFVTQVSGTTYLLAAIEQDYQFTFTHRDNGVIMTDTTVEEISESVTFNRIQAAGGVNLDPNSQIVLSAVRDPLFDSAHLAAWTTEAENGRSMLANAYLGIDSPAKDQGGSDNKLDTLTAGKMWDSGTEEEEDRHWREGGEWSEEGEFLVTQVALPTGADGAEYAYLAGVLGRDSTINDPIELVSYSFYDRQQAISPAFKVVATIAVSTWVGDWTAWANLPGWMQAAATAATSTVIVETGAGVVSGEVDIEDILAQAGKSALTAGLTAGIDASMFGVDLEDVGWANTSPFQLAGFGDKLTIAKLVEAGIDATLTSGVTIALDKDLDGSDFLELFGSSMRSSAINLTMADLQDGIGDLKLGEGSFEHAALHGLVGCAAAEALDGNCASGAAAGIAQSIFAGVQRGEPNRNDFASNEAYLASHQAWRNDIAAQANLLGAAVGYVTSSGEAANVSNAASIAKSGAQNNYLGHTELRQYHDELATCQLGDVTCFNDIAQKYEKISAALDVEFAACETDQCRLYHLSRIEAAEQSGAFDEIIIALSGRMTEALDDYRIELTNLQYDRAGGVDPTLYENLDTVGRAQLRIEVVGTMCGGTNVDSCSISTRYDLLEWGALNQPELMVLAGDVMIARYQARERVHENMRFDQCGTMRGASCEALVSAEILRLEARAARIGGVLMIVGGGLEIVASGAAATTCQTGIGCIAAASLATHGTDIAGHGLVQLWTGEIVDTYGGALLQQAGLSPAQAELVYGFMGAGIEVVALRAMLKTPAAITPNALATYQRTGVLPEGLAPNTGAGYPALARPTANSQGNVILGDLDNLGRPTGVTSTITGDMIGTGTSANPAIRPPGFAGGVNNHSRGHLLANILGGSGTDARNLVTLFQRHANSPNMRHFETQVRNAVDGGQVVNFRAIPIYSGNNPVPTGVTMTARGSGGFDLDVSILNINGMVQ